MDVGPLQIFSSLILGSWVLTLNLDRLPYLPVMVCYQSAS